jgi:hypothetical protein
MMKPGVLQLVFAIGIGLAMVQCVMNDNFSGQTMLTLLGGQLREYFYHPVPDANKFVYNGRRAQLLLFEDGSDFDGFLHPTKSQIDRLGSMIFRHDETSEADTLTDEVSNHLMFLENIDREKSIRLPIDDSAYQAVTEEDLSSASSEKSVGNTNMIPKTFVYLSSLGQHRKQVTQSPNKNAIKYTHGPSQTNISPPPTHVKRKIAKTVTVNHQPIQPHLASTRPIKASAPNQAHPGLRRTPGGDLPALSSRASTTT